MKKKHIFFSFFIGLFLFGFILCKLFQKPIVCYHLDDNWISYHYDRVLDRNLHKPMILFLGGSEVREGIDLQDAEDFFKKKNIQFFSLAHRSTGNGILEQYQMMSHISLQKKDLVFFNIEPLYFTESQEPILSKPFQSAEVYHQITKINGDQFDLNSYLNFFFSEKINFYRNRNLIKLCVLSLQYKDFSEINEKRYFYGSKSKPEEYFEKEFSKYHIQKMGFDQKIDDSLINIKIIKYIKETYQNVVFWEFPRNPKYKKIHDPNYMDMHKKNREIFNVIKVDEKIKIPEDYFFDFNHLLEKGRKEYGSKILELAFEIYQNRISDEK